VLVRWWLLALPHHVVLSILFSGEVWLSTGGGTTGKTPRGARAGGLLVLSAAIVRLFTGRYPGSVYRLVVGLDRWALRVTGYAALMTDEYPPFRLDQGGTAPGHASRGGRRRPPGATSAVEPRPPHAPAFTRTGNTALHRALPGSPPGHLLSL
jgi:hypothetical protein